ncbi:MAG: alpha/beta fold hydrolase, partial [Micromonosporaceae bacterium]
WGLDRPHVVAHDFGGAVSLRSHLVHDVPYASLLMADVVAIPPSGSPFFRLVKQHPDVLAQVPPYIHEALVRTYIGNASHRGLREDDLAALVAPWLGEDGQPAFYRQIAQADQRYTDEIAQWYATIDIPVLVCWGADDTWIPAARASELHEAIPGSALRIIDGAGHLVQEDAPAELTAVLLDFLRGPLSGPGPGV